MFKILVVEDDINLSDSIKVFLSKKGFQVFCSYSAKYALMELDNYQVDLIVTDIMMPGINGIEFIRVVRDMGIKVPILITPLSSPKSSRFASSSEFSAIYIERIALISRLPSSVKTTPSFFFQSKLRPSLFRDFSPFDLPRFANSLFPLPFL